MWPTLRRIVLGALLALVLLAVAVGVGLVPVNLFFLKDTLQKEIHLQTGLTFEVNGALRLRLGPRPSVTARDIRLSAEGEALAAARFARIRTGLWNSLKGEIDIQGFELEDLAVAYCEDGRCRISMPESGWQVSGRAPLGQATRISVTGEMPGGNAALESEGGPLTELLEWNEPFPMSLSATLPGAKGSFEGRVVPVGDQMPDISLTGELESGDVQVLLSSMGIAEQILPQGQSRLAAGFGLRAGAGGLMVDEFRGQLGNVDFALAGSARWDGERPVLEVRGGLGSVRADEWRELYSDDDSGALTDVSLAPLLDILQGFDGALDLGVDEIWLHKERLLDLRIQARLEGGRLEIDRAGLAAEGQVLVMSAVLDSVSDCPAFNADFRLENLDTEWLERLAGESFPMHARVGLARGALQSCGMTLEAHRDSAAVAVEAEQIIPGQDGQALPVTISGFKGEFAWRQPGRADLQALFGGESISGEVSFGRLEQLASGDDWPIEARAAGVGSVFKVKGSAALGAAGIAPVFDLAAELESPNPERITRWAGFNPQGSLPLTLRVRARSDSRAYFFEVDEARLGLSDLSGRIEWAGPESGLPILASLRSGALAVDEIGQWLPAADSSEADTVDENQAQRQGESALPPVQLDWQAVTVRAGTFEARNASFAGTVHASGVNNARFGLSIADTPVQGLLDLDFTQNPARLAFDFELENPEAGDLVSALGLTRDVDARARNAEVHVQTRGNSWREWLGNAGAEARINDLVWHVASHDEDGESTLFLKNAMLDLRPGADSTLEGNGRLDDLPLVVRLNLPPLKTVLDPSRLLPFTLAVGTDMEIVLLEARLDRRTTGRLLTDLILTAEFRDEAALPDPDRITSPRADLQLETRLGLADRHARLERLVLKTGRSRVEGNADLRGDFENLDVKVKLTAPRIETEDFVLFSARWQQQADPSQTESRDAETDEETSVLAILRRELALLDTVFFDVGIEVEELYSAGEFLGRGQLGFSSDPDHVSFHLDTDGPGGVVNADYRSDSFANGTEMQLDTKIERFEFGGLMRLLNPESTATGQLFLDSSFSSRVDESQRILEKLAGNIDMLLIPREVGAAWLDIWASNLLFALLSAGEAADKKMNCMAARFDVEEGVMTTNETLLDTTDIIVRARGEIDLAQGWIDLLLAPQAKRERFLSVQTPVEIKGPLDDFEAGIEAGGIFSTLVRWYYGLIYVPWKWLTGERYPADGLATCFAVLDLPPPEAQP